MRYGLRMAAYTILTGDLIASSRQSADRLGADLAALEDMARQQATWHGALLRFSRHRGDGWQVALACPSLALRSALSFAAVLRARGSSSYMALATGVIGTALPDDLNTASGPVFTASGHLLDEIKQARGPRIALADPGPAAAAFALADHIAQGWTEAQAETLLPMLAPNGTPSFTALAQAMGKSRQAVTKALDGAGYDAIRRALLAYEQEDSPS